MIEREKEVETVRIIERVSRDSDLDLEATEIYIRTSALAMGASILEQLLHDVGVGRQKQPRICARNHLPRKMESRGVHERTIETILGPIRFARSRYVCRECGATVYPGDELLEVTDTRYSPGLRRLMTRAGCLENFAEAAEDLQVYGAIQVTPKAVERVAEHMGRVIDDWMARQGSAALLAAPGKEQIPVLYIGLDGTGVPVRQSEVEGRKGKGEDGRARTREVKLGCVFTQTTVDEEGNPVREPESTTYVGAIESSADFGNRLCAEAVRRGLKRAQETVVLSDGAEYNARIAQDKFAGATHIIDRYHASERLSDFFKDNINHPAEGEVHQACQELLHEGLIEQLTDTMRQSLPRSGQRRAQGLKRINYFSERKEQMRYGEFRRRGLFIGSGVIEAGCKTVIGKRLKQSGMFWSVKGANAIIAGRCCIKSGRFEQFWEDLAS